MGEKKTIQFSSERNPQVPVPAAFYASAFSIRTEMLSSLLLEILFQPGVGSIPVVNLVLDVGQIKDNTQSFVRYLAELPGTPSDDALNDKIPYINQTAYSNIFNCGATSHRSETLFGLMSIHQSARMRRKASSTDVQELFYDPVLAVYGSIGFQKKLISEILRIIK
jgi:hypothetical protein